MVRFVFGSSGSGKSEYILRDIQRNLSQSQNKIILIVPEQHTVSTERRTAKRYAPSAALRMEVTNFTRLSDSISRKVGGLTYSARTRGADMLMLWRALLSVHGGLSELACNGGDPVSVLSTVYSALRELTLGAVTESKLSAAADSLEEIEGETSLSRRTRDLALIGEAWRQLAEDEYASFEDPVMKIKRCASESGYFDGCDVYVDSFYSMTGAQLAALSEIIRHAASVTITIPMKDRHADGIHLAGVKSFYKSVLGAALRYSEAEFVTLEGNYRCTTRELYTLSEHLWDYSFDGECDTELPSVPESAVLYSVADRYEEAEALCSVIAEKVRGGARYSDIAVVAADTESLSGITDSAMRRHGIPIFTSRSERITSSPAVRLIISLLRIVGRWRGEDVISVVKTGLSSLSNDLACAFENYTDTWNIRGHAMFTSPWSMNPDGYKESLSERARQTLANANEAREIIIPPIERFCTVFEGGRAPIRKICEALVEYFAETGAYRAMTERAKTLSPDDSAREMLVWSEICTAFDTMTRIAGDIVCDSSGFASLFRLVIADADTGAIPTGVDNVTFASAAGLRTDGVRHVIILGAVDGEFPIVPSSDGYFTDSDRERLAETGVVLGSRTDERASEELFRFYRAVSQASESLTVFVPKSSAGSSCIASEGASRIMKLTKGDIVPFRSLPAERRLFDRLSIDDELRITGDPALARLRRELYGDCPVMSAPSAEDARVSDETARLLFGGNLNLTQSRIEKFAGCPMSYYCSYILKLSEDKKATLDSSDVGKFVHKILEEFFTVTAGKEYPLPKEETEKICDSIIENYVRCTCGGELDGRMKYLFIRLRRKVLVFLDAIMEEAAQSRFETWRTELPVGGVHGEGDALSPPPIVFPCDDGGSVSLYGIIDRLDIYKSESDNATYIRVIDYKTGNKTFSYEDVKAGLNIQLLLYLFSAWRSEGSAFAREITSTSGKILPAGALYLSVKPGDPTADFPLNENEARELMASTVKRSGIVTDNRDVLDAMDSGISGKYIPVSLKTDGTFKKSASLASLERFGQLYRELGEVITGIAHEMKSGFAAARPVEQSGYSPCTWCSLKEICRKEDK